MSNFEQWTENKVLPNLCESISTSRYSVEVNFRSKLDDVIDEFAKLSLGYISAAMKNCGFHVRILFDEKPFRVIISTRNWDDGEWVGVIIFNSSNCFVLAKGIYNKDRKTVSIHGNRKCLGTSAAEVSKDLRNYMEKLKKEKPISPGKLKPAKMKRGPKPKFSQKLNSKFGF